MCCRLITVALSEKLTTNTHREDDDAEVPERPQKLKRSIEFDSAAQCATADMAMNPSQNGDVETVRRGSNSTSQADPATESNDRVRPTGLEERLGLPTTFPPTPIESSSEHSPPEVLIPLIDRDGTRAARPYVQPNTYVVSYISDLLAG